MSFVGIIVNPDSGRDVRRIISQAVTISNEQKLNIVARLLVALDAVGVERIKIMPDRFGIGKRAFEMVASQSGMKAEAALIDMPATWTATDTLRAAQSLHDEGADCIVVLGGDGTSRLVAKACGDIPVLPISTGTNNVVPDFIEGTIAGMAAGYVARHPERRDAFCYRHKRLIVQINGQEADQALVDVTIINHAFTGSRAVWDIDLLRQLFVTRSDPSRIGLSSVLGMLHPVATGDPWGAVVSLNNGGSQRVRAPIVPGGFAEIAVSDVKKLEPGVPYRIDGIRPAAVALDGEREFVLRPGSDAAIMLDLDGPWLVDVQATMDQAARDQLFVYTNT